MDSKKAKDDDWIKVPSKTRPGKHYLFNRSTGETQWTSEAQTKNSDTSGTTPAKKGERVESPPRISVPKPLKTPAQDRLKRLQHNIKVDQIKKVPNKIPRRPDMEGKSKKLSDSKEQQENVSRDKPSTSTSSKTKPKPLTNKSHTSPKQACKRPNSSSSGPSIEKKKTHSQVVSTTNEEKKKMSLKPTATPVPAKNAQPKKSEDNNKSTLASIVLGEDFEMIPCETSTPALDILRTPQKPECKTSTLDNIRTGIVGKIREICKLPFRSSKSRVQNGGAEEAKTSKLCAKLELKSGKKSQNKSNVISPAVQLALNELREEQRQIAKQNLNKSTESSPQSLNSSVQQTTPKNFNIPVYQKGSANSRLDRLRQSLLLQQSSTNYVTPSISSPVTAPLINTTNSANNIDDDEVEAMDWQPITKEDETTQIFSSESSISLPSQNIRERSIKNDAETMGEIYDTVNENLLRLSAEKQRSSSKNNNKWLKDFYYFVVDTNVMLDHLTFIEDLTKLKLCDTKGSMLYIPYSVLQELDKLKMASGYKEGVKTLSVRAIKYLNKKFENKSQHLLAQTALEERNHLIDVNSADDSIINCCLQAKTHVPNLLLLTEDVNLRNKAICNNILVSTKSDLLSKRYGGDSADDSRS